MAVFLVNAAIFVRDRLMAIYTDRPRHPPGRGRPNRTPRPGFIPSVVPIRRAPS